jgi:hypothetical protein
MPGNVVSLPAVMASAEQQNLLIREFVEGLDSELAYRRDALLQILNARGGETLTITRPGRFAPVTTPLAPQSSMLDLNNGLTPQVGFPIEQYTFQMQEWAASAQVDLMGELVVVANMLNQTARNLGVQAAQSLERLARNSLYGVYMGGNTFVRTDLGASTTTTCHVNDIRGFQQVMVNGVLTPISSANPITVVETGTVSQTLTVTAATADATNNTAAVQAGGISGVLTFNTATAPASGDALIAAGAPSIVRPMGKTATNQVVSSDFFTMSVFQDAETILKNNAVPTFLDGHYHVVLDNTSLRQLWADQDFKLLFAGREMSPEFRFGDIIGLLGGIFIPCTEVYVDAPMSAAGVATTVRRPIIYGMEHLIEGRFEGLETWLARDGMSMIAEPVVSNGVAMIVVPPIDALQRWARLSWTFVGAWVVPSDATATPTIIPTASNANWKRAVVIEHAG